MTKDELWDLFTRARAAQLVAREAWTTYHLTLTGWNEKECLAARAAHANSENLEEKAIRAMQEEIEG